MHLLLGTAFLCADSHTRLTRMSKQIVCSVACSNMRWLIVKRFVSTYSEVILTRIRRRYRSTTIKVSWIRGFVHQRIRILKWKPRYQRIVDCLIALIQTRLIVTLSPFVTSDVGTCPVWNKSILDTLRLSLILGRTSKRIVITHY